VDKKEKEKENVTGEPKQDGKGMDKKDGWTNLFFCLLVVYSHLVRIKIYLDYS
jgi:hypothetical protein